MNKGIFTISLDFELHWGGFEKWPVEKYRQYFLNTRSVIPEMLKLFETYGVHVTWATVGILFASSREEFETYQPAVKPSYSEGKLSAYNYIRDAGIGDNENDDPLHYAPSLIRQIVNTPNQEIGTHTFAHVYCNEAGQTPDAFKNDLEAAIAISRKFGCEISSLVFPRNQFNQTYLKICRDVGITAVRSNPVDWFWKIDSTQKESGWKRLNRGLDAYFPVGSHNSYKLRSITAVDGLPICLPASRLLRPYNPKEYFLNAVKISRIASEMERAAKRNECYHLWWHPHNFGNYPEQSLAGLRAILEAYRKCNTAWGMVSMNMKELSSMVSNGK
jgi:peptidoglycan/xylan/chitin deacetylase (PgdA/CDA1 family)